MRKNRTNFDHLTTCVVRRERNSLCDTETKRAPRTPRTCPPQFEIWPAFRIWYVQRIVSRSPPAGELAAATVTLEKPRSPDPTRLGPIVGVVWDRNIIFARF